MVIIISKERNVCRKGCWTLCAHTRKERTQSKHNDHKEETNENNARKQYPLIKQHPYMCLFVKEELMKNRMENYISRQTIY